MRFSQKSFGKASTERDKKKLVLKNLWSSETGRDISYPLERTGGRGKTTAEAKCFFAAAVCF